LGVGEAEIGGGFGGGAAGIFRRGRGELEEAAAAELEVGGGVRGGGVVLESEGLGAGADAEVGVRRRSLHDHGGDVAGDFGLLHVLAHVRVLQESKRKKLEKERERKEGFLEGVRI